MFLAGKRIERGTGHEAGRALLEEMYLRHVGVPMPSIGVTERGKPYFVDGPWHFSISHTDRHVFCGLSQRPVGIDAEEEDRPVRLELAKKILSAGELSQWEQAEDPRIALLTFWVLKEAQAKLTGEGIRFHPTHTEFSLCDRRVTRLHGCLVAVIEEEDHAV